MSMVQVTLQYSLHDISLAGRVPIPGWKTNWICG